jgi:cytochrome oxidase assembly protein ShyY1
MMLRRWHQPSALAWLLLAIGIAAFAKLGMWQLDRARQKEELLAAFSAAATQPAQEFAAVRDAADAQRYPHVRVAGHFLAGRSYLRDEQMHDGHLGVHAIAVFAVTGEDRLLLVDRGWIAWNHAPNTLPSLPLVDAGETTLSGIYAPFPGSGLRVGGDALRAQSVWPKLTLRLDAAEIAADLGKPVLPRMLLLDADASSGFVREWTPNVMPPLRHRAYAFQWFTFAVVALVVFVVVHWRKPDKK